MCFTFMLHEGVVRRLGDEESPGGGWCCWETIAYELRTREWNRVLRSCVIPHFMEPKLNQPFMRSTSTELLSTDLFQ